MGRSEQIVIPLMLISLLVAWFVGAQQEQSDLNPILLQALPRTGTFEEVAPGLYTGSDTSSDTVVGYVALGRANGYGGPLLLAVGADPRGRTEHVVIFDQNESVPFFRRVLDRNITGALAGRDCTDPAALGTDIDAVSGATISTNAILKATRAASRRIAAEGMHLPVPPEKETPIVFGKLEVTIFLLVLAAQVSFLKRFKYKKQFRWATLIGGLAIIGFLCATPISLVNVNACLLGYWPDWRERLGWYMVFAAFLLPILLRGKDTYCTHLCPFGAAQQCVGLVGGAKPRRLPRSLKNFGRWLPRVLSWGFILTALLYRTPGTTNHEVFAVLFERTGTSFQVGLLVAVLLVSLFLRRPWCRYLCAIRPVADLLRSLRRQLIAASRRKSRVSVP
jgi:hypothetical protein